MQTLPGHATKTKLIGALNSLSRLVPAVNHRPARPDALRRITFSLVEPKCVFG